MNREVAKKLTFTWYWSRTIFFSNLDLVPAPVYSSKASITRNILEQSRVIALVVSDNSIIEGLDPLLLCRWGKEVPRPAGNCVGLGEVPFKG